MRLGHPVPRASATTVPCSSTAVAQVTVSQETRMSITKRLYGEIYNYSLKQGRERSVQLKPMSSYLV